MPALHPQRRRDTAERSFSRKRNPLPQANAVPVEPLNNAFSLTGPITLTINRPPPGTNPSVPPPTSVPPVPPPSVPPASPLSSSSPIQSTFTPPPTQTLQPPTDTPTLPPLPPSSVLNEADPEVTASDPSVSSNLSSTSGASSKTIPPGAIVGIVIAGVLLLLTVVVLLVRRSFKQNRMQRRATWLNNGGISNQTMMANAPVAQSVSTFAPTERYSPNVNTYGASSLPGAGAASMALAAVGVSDPSGGETSPGYTFASAQAQAIAIAISSPPATYNNPVGGVSPKTVPSVISAGDVATVKFTFIPSLPDELSISNGEIVRVIQEYDDGWALCVNGREVQGMVPVECLERGGDGGANNGYDARSSLYGGNGDARNSRRASSLNIIQATGSRR